MAIKWINESETIEPTGAFTESAVLTASYILYKLTAEKYTGPQDVTEAYILGSRDGMSVEPTIIGGGMYNIPDISGNGRDLRLRHSPVMSVTSVHAQGRLMAPSEYTLRNNAYLVRQNSLPWILSTMDDLTVTYRFGTNPPAAGKRAALRLANEFILSDRGDGRCSLPERISSINRQGVSYTIMDPQEYISNGKVGIYEVDLFLAAANPHKAKKRPKVFSVDRPRGERIN